MQQIAFWFCARRSVSSCTRLHQFSHAPDCMGFSANVGVYSRAPVCSYHAPDCMLWSAPVCICNSVMSTVCNLRPFAVFHRARSLVFNCARSQKKKKKKNKKKKKKKYYKKIKKKKKKNYKKKKKLSKKKKKNIRVNTTWTSR